MSAAVSLRDAPACDVQALAHLEWRLTSPMGFGLTTASPLQRAICRVADGRQLRELGDDSVVRRALGGTLPSCVKPRELAILSGIRVGKSLLAAALAVHWSQACDLSQIGPGEVPRVSIVSLTKDLADVVFGHVVGRLQQSPLLRHLVVGEPSGGAVFVRHHTGRTVEIRVVAGSRAGASLVSRWSAGCIFDEFPRMVGGEDGVVNWDDQRNAMLERLLPGAQMVHIGSPWRPMGPAFEMVDKHWRAPTSRLVVIKAPGPDMNPSWWTPERVEEAKANPDVYRTDVMAEFATPEQAFLASDVVDRCMRRDPVTLPREAGCHYTAAMDPATRGNGWTLVIATRKGDKKIIARAEEWRGSRSDPLNPDAVMIEVADILTAYGITLVESDQYMGDALGVIARNRGITIVERTVRTDERSHLWRAIRTKMEMGEVELPDAPHLRSDLLSLKKRITATGVAIHLPLTADGRHADYAPAVMLALSRYLSDAAATKPKPGVYKPAQDAETVAARNAVLKKFGGKKGPVW